MTEQYEKPFLVNIEGPDDIEEFDTMREAAERAHAINADLVDTISRGGEHAPHLWAVPWRTTTYLSHARGEPVYDLASKTWDKTCPCVEAMQTDPDCEWNGRIARMEASEPGDPS